MGNRVGRIAFKLGDILWLGGNEIGKSERVFIGT